MTGRLTKTASAADKNAMGAVAFRMTLKHVAV